MAMGFTCVTVLLSMMKEVPSGASRASFTCLIVTGRRVSFLSDYFEIPA
jgi:hypothetical protein